MKLNFRQRLLATTLLVGAAGLLASPAFAQDAPAPAPAPADEAPAETVAPVEGTSNTLTETGEPVSSQDIVVTGSRIPQPNLTSASPVTVITATEIKLQGTTRTEDLINSLPQAFAAQGSNIANGATGIATVDLRDLGSARTLVLINGRRLQPGDPRTPVADINFIPSSLIKRVDVLTGGASSVYGADAVAGVVNFIMDTGFTGLRIDGQASVFNHNNHTNSDVKEAIQARNFPLPRGMSTNGGAQDISIAFGTNFDDNRGHIMGYATYRNQDAILESTRDYSACALTGVSEAQSVALGRNFNCGGSNTSALGTFQQFNPTTFAFRGNFQIDPVTGNFIPGATPFNYAPTNYYQRPDERYTFGVFAEYEVTDYLKPYMEAMYMDDQSVAQIAPSGDFGNTNTLNCDNPLLSTQQRTFLCENPAFPTFIDDNGVERALVYTLRRNVEGGGRQDDLEHISYRIVAGTRGDLARGLSYDASYQFGKTILSETYLNDFSVTRLGRALDVVSDPDTGAPVCRSVLDGTDPNCVPWNIFTVGGVTPEALAYLQTPGFQRGNVQETIAQLNFTLEGGEYGFQFPWSDRGVGINVGAEYRKEKLRNDTDTAFSTGDLAGQGGPTIGVAGEFDVKDLYGEIQVPIISNGIIEELTFSAGYRYSSYDVANNKFSTDTYKIAAEFAPIKDIRLRGSYNRSVRAPNVVELFAVQSLGLTGSVDQCAGDLTNASTADDPTATAAQCALTGVTAAQYGQITPSAADQYNGFIGGNPDLSPETADSYTLGLVLQPRFLPGFAMTIDAFKIKVRDAIGTIGFDNILTQCLNTGDPFLCSKIHRAPGTGSLWLGTEGFITDINTNVGGIETRGFDVNTTYTRQIGDWGTLNTSMVGTYLDQLKVNPFADIEYNCAGLFGNTCGTPVPKWRSKSRTTFTFRNGIGVSVQFRYFSKVDSDATSNDEDLEETPASSELFPGNDNLHAQYYFDLAFSAKIKDQLNLRVGVNNIFDRDPPVAGGQVIFAGAGNGNTFPQVYDAMGRYLFAGFTVDF